MCTTDFEKGGEFVNLPDRRTPADDLSVTQVVRSVRDD